MADPSALVDELGSLLEKLEATPHNVALLQRQLHLMTRLHMSNEILDTILKLSSLVMLDEDVWLSYFDGVIQAAARPLTLESFVDILERFDQAEQDYFSLPILLRHVEFILGCVHSAPGVDTTETTEKTASDIDSELQAFLTVPTVREMLRGVTSRGAGLLSQSHLLWQPWIDWELSLGEADEIHLLFLQRISEPHSTMDATASMYSTYCSEHCPTEYESRMIAFTAQSQKAKHKWAGEKRSGKTREDLEQSLISSDPLEIWSTYIDWETDPRAQNPKNDRAPTTDVTLTRAVFERALAVYGKTAAAMESGLEEAEEGAEQQVKQGVLAYKTAEADLWDKYALWTKDVAVRARAVRACPQIGTAWREVLTQQETSGEDPEEIFQKALDLGQLGQPGDISTVFACRAAHLNRQDRADPQPVLAAITSGFETVKRAEKTGDPSLQLEKFLVDWAETVHPEILDNALQLVDRPLKSRSSSYQMVLLLTGVEIRRGNIAAARDRFKHAIHRADLDWPDFIYEAFLQFENIHGDIETLTTTSQLIAIEREKVAKRRAKAAQESQDYYVPRAEAAPAEVITAPSAIATAATAAPPPEDNQPKRDREHTTILVTGLSPNTDKAQLESFFIEFGHIREITVLGGDTPAALIEFRFADAVPSALTRDRKQLDGSQLHVSMLWRSTLFVTNFPRDMDDQGIRALFSQYGSILQTRWPSRKYSDSRRFCYITMQSPASAQECLLLNGMQIEGLSLTVLISDPAVRARRTDASESANHTLFVGGLVPKTSERDVEDLLNPHGQVTHVKLGWDPVKRLSKGFAFVEMASAAGAAAACQALHGTQRNGKFLKVEISDPNHAAKKPNTSSAAGAQKAVEKRQRTVRLHDLPPGAQEGLLQQELEKICPVKRLEIFERAHEALVELETQADAGLLLLRPEPFVFNGATITFTESGRKPPPTTTTTSLSFAPRAARQAKAIPKPRPQTSKPAPPSNSGQDFFRDLVQTKNTERGENKRKAEEAASSAAKRPKGEQS